MKKLCILFAFFLFHFAASAQIISFADPDLKAILLLTSSDEFPIAKDLSGNFFKIDANNDGEIQLSEALQVSYIDLHVMSEMEDMNGIENFTNLKALYASNNVSVINLTGLVNLELFYCANNQLTILDMTGSPNLKYLDCSWGEITSLNITGLVHLEYLDMRANNLVHFDLSSITNLKTLYCSSNRLTSLNVTGLSQLQFVDCSRNQLTDVSFSEISSLQHLDVNNNYLTSIELNGLNNLEYLDCYYNSLTSIDLTGLNSLTTFNCSQNLFTSLNLSGLTNLYGFFCNGNQLSSIDISNLHLLQFFECNDNLLTSLDFTGLSNLSHIYCSHNQLTTIDVSNLPNLDYFLCSYNLFTTLDLTANHNLNRLICEENPNLTTLYVKNGSNEYTDFVHCPGLQYICADDNELNYFQQVISNYNLINCHVNSYCSFTPGGVFYSMQGNNRYDLDENGCDVNDIHFPNLKIVFSDGITTSNLMGDDTGIYHYDVQEGTQTITPVLENPNYFTVSPTVTNVTFPASASPFIQDFCVTANGFHNDLEVFLIPITTARPGFDAHYQIIYKNKGTTTQSGSVNLFFNDSVLDFVSANPILSSHTTNNLNWDFTNLLPFESRQIIISLNVNSPAEPPAVNNGDILNYSANVIAANDETPDDNTSVLNQIVRNSLDPNDKTCLEGTKITPSMVGKYVHYMIRFENTGSFAAENIVVADIIDLNKFDITTLIPESSSHNFVTRINGNKVEFIFKNVNLSYDDANNDGYVMFKIKTKSTLQIGDTFSNTATIYFDYNFPVVTNTTSTTVALLNNYDFEFDTFFSLSPVPTKNVLTIISRQNVKIKSISIYNALGQLVQVNMSPSETIDVSGLKTGNYFFKIISDKGAASTKFVKE